MSARPGDHDRAVDGPRALGTAGEDTVLRCSPPGQNLALTRTYIRFAIVMLCSYLVLYGNTQWLEAAKRFSGLNAGLLLLPITVVSGIVTIPVTFLRLPGLHRIVRGDRRRLPRQCHQLGDRCHRLDHARHQRGTALARTDRPEVTAHRRHRCSRREARSIQAVTRTTRQTSSRLIRERRCLRIAVARRLPVADEQHE